MPSDLDHPIDKVSSWRCVTDRHAMFPECSLHWPATGPPTYLGILKFISWLGSFFLVPALLLPSNSNALGQVSSPINIQFVVGKISPNNTIKIDFKTAISGMAKMSLQYLFSLSSFPGELQYAKLKILTFPDSLTRGLSMWHCPGQWYLNETF